MLRNQTRKECCDESPCATKDCCEARVSAVYMLQIKIDQCRHRLAGLEKLLKVAEFARDDSNFEALLYELVSNLDRPDCRSI